MTVKPKERITIAELMCHPWLMENSAPMRPLSSAPVHDDNVHARVLQAMVKFGFTAERVEASLAATACDDAFATYRFLEAKLKKLGVKRRLLPRTHSDNVSVKQLGEINSAVKGDTGLMLAYVLFSSIIIVSSVSTSVYQADISTVPSAATVQATSPSGPAPAVTVTIPEDSGISEFEVSFW